MGKQLGGINGPFVGKVGNVVGYQWKGRWVTRSMPSVFHDAESEGQLKERSRLGASMSLAARLRDILLIGFKQVANEARMTEYNYFYKTNNRCLAWDGEQLAVDYEHLRLSEGPVAPVRFGAVEVVGEMTLALDFEKNPEHRVSGSSDKVYVAAICATLGFAVLSLPVYRRMKRITVSLPRTWEGQEVHLYGFVTDYAGRASDSTYIGCMAFGESDNLHSSYNKKAVSALAMENTDNHHTYETSNISGPYTGIRRNADGSGPAEGSQSDARGCPSGGSQFSYLHRY